MSLFRVVATVQKKGVFFVEAADYESARQDAEILADDLDDLDYDLMQDSVITAPARHEPDDNDEVWTGGPDGEFISGREFKERNDKTSNA